jgi:GntR family transcriptional regulator/MocR family aminotransferase
MLVTLAGSGPLYEQVYASMRGAILEGRLRPGTRLPPTRALAAELDVARATVVLAYEQLLAEGYAEARQGSGTFVARALPDAAPLGAAPQPARRKAAPPRLSAFGQRWQSRPPRWRSPGPPPRFDLRYGRPFTSDFPQELWARIVSRHARRLSVRRLDYPQAAGETELREQVVRYLARSRGVAADVEQVIVTAGSQQALDALARIVVDKGSPVAMEHPGYAGARLAFEAAGAAMVDLAVDGDGLVTSALPERDDLRALYLTPSNQFPLGSLLPMGRRLELIEWAARTGTLLVEDDYDSEYRYRGRPVAALQGLAANTATVAYLGTFSKALFPALRLGYAVLPPSLVAPFLAAKQTGGAGTPVLEQLATAEFLADGHFERHLRRTRAIALGRRDALLGAFDREFGSRVQLAGGDAGLHLTVFFRDVPLRRSSALFENARAAGVGIEAAKGFWTRPPAATPAVLGYAGIDAGDIPTAIRLLREVVDRMRVA